MQERVKSSTQKIKLYTIASFLAGVSLATLIYSGVYLGPQLQIPNKPTLEESVLAEMLYDNFQRYTDNCNIEKVTALMSQIETGHYTKLEKQKYDEVLLQLVAKKANRKALANLQKSEEYLERLAKSENILPVVDKKIYIEILQEGTGDAIVPETNLSLHLKQFDENGKLIKDTGDSEPSNISLSKMVKGFKIGIEGARVGEKRKIYIHPEYGFSKTKSGSSAGHLLIYEVSIIGQVPKTAPTE